MGQDYTSCLFPEKRQVDQVGLPQLNKHSQLPGMYTMESWEKNCILYVSLKVYSMGPTWCSQPLFFDEKNNTSTRKVMSTNLSHLLWLFQVCVLVSEVSKILCLNCLSRTHHSSSCQSHTMNSFHRGSQIQKPATFFCCLKTNLSIFWVPDGF